jgi:predicted small lipoprotein YifL
MRNQLSSLLLLAALLLGACCNTTPTALPPATLDSDPITFPKIDRYPSPADFSDRGTMTSLPTYDPQSDDPEQMDLRAYDLSPLDLSGSLNDLLYASFDDQTVWPPNDRMPPGFDRQRIMELGKDSGLGVRSLHRQGITGRGVSIAIIDQPLLVEHQEYVDRLQLYEEINVDPTTPSQIHGPAVASIAVGKTVGVAPEADLYYIGSWTGDWGVGAEGFTWNLSYYAQAIRRILQINDQLPKGQRIRVISMQVGWNPEQAGYDEITEAVQEAKEAGMLVICSSFERETVHGFRFNGLGRAPLADPDSFESYEPGLFWAQYREGNLCEQHN